MYREALEETMGEVEGEEKGTGTKEEARAQVKKKC